MHRTGTSATARLVNLLGVPIGQNTDRSLLPEVNPTGFWESHTLTAFNDHLLCHLGGSWAAPPTLPPGWEADTGLTSYRQTGRALFRCVHPTERWVWKDPRTCVTLPFWLLALEARSAIVLTHRNPLEITRSLHPRFGVGKRLALAIWERYMRSALAASRGLPVFVMPYAGLISRPRHWTERLGAFLTQHGIASSPAEGAEGAAAFIDPDLRHHALEQRALNTDRDVTPEQREIFALLESGVGEHDVFEGWRLPPAGEEVEALLAPRRERDLAHWSKAIRNGHIDPFVFAGASSERPTEVD
jgi:hypothetical protein